ncbi:hypothetical protein [Aureibacter tunicatorum]|uniref:Uncharacterized protein n=1 Tax=Aureibacter tunicatorum TaxID=866807 RepID=A0AAE3XNC7_9BACT|nr:hypothetical protein [Aureibacter tunicatorum]MDR6241101.1 hypothetical protein [Aureibacter tunicatorum]BDD03879.1 hypothetical protein AUTU_13620 [Aureibacter tunicatorum]
MKFEKINIDWSPEPNAPYQTLFKNSKNLELIFYLNPFIHKNINDDDIGIISFNNCFKFRLGKPNSDEFYRNQFRYNSKDLEFYDFYELKQSDWEKNFPKDEKILLNQDEININNLKHYILFFRDETFECLAYNYEFVNIGEKLSFKELLEIKKREMTFLLTRY